MMPDEEEAMNDMCAECTAPGMRWNDKSVRTFFVLKLGGCIPLCRMHAVERRCLSSYEYTPEETLWLASRKVKVKRRIAVVLAKHPGMTQD